MAFDRSLIGVIKRKFRAAGKKGEDPKDFFRDSLREELVKHTPHSPGYQSFNHSLIFMGELLRLADITKDKPDLEHIRQSAIIALFLQIADPDMLLWHMGNVIDHPEKLIYQNDRTSVRALTTKIANDHVKGGDALASFPEMVDAFGRAATELYNNIKGLGKKPAKRAKPVDEKPRSDITDEYYNQFFAYKMAYQGLKNAFSEEADAMFKIQATGQLRKKIKPKSLISQRVVVPRSQAAPNTATQKTLRGDPEDLAVELIDELKKQVKKARSTRLNKRTEDLLGHILQANILRCIDNQGILVELSSQIKAQRPVVKEKYQQGIEILEQRLQMRSLNIVQNSGYINSK